ncbi:hypothetical protein [Streptomyces sp. H27-G5]|uniref:hypothetical protein n=1 Tax=Streptomyces sp. H27-G5 TaxID=2996698 RepID=UPI003B63C97B
MLYLMVMDGPHPETARGLPFTWRGVGLPANGTTFEAAVEAADDTPAEAPAGDTDQGMVRGPFPG